MSQFPSYTGGLAIPSMNEVLGGVENQPWFGRVEQQVWLPDTISGAARDAGNTVTTLLRPGLLLGKITTSGLIKEWAPTATDGSQDIYGVLGAVLLAQQNGTNQQRYLGAIQLAGNLYSDRIIIPGNATEGIVGDALEFQVLNQLNRRFLLDRHLGLTANGPLASRFRYLTDAENTAHALSASTADHGRTFLASYINSSGAVTAITADTTLTLPAAKIGLMFSVFANSPSYKMAIALVSGSIKLPDADGTATTCDLNFGESATFIGTAAGVYQMIMQSESTTD